MNESIREFVTQLTNEQLFAVWFLIGAALVFWMQAGFAMVEAGFTRAKNTGNIIMKNLMDFCIGTVTFILIGFGLLMGEDLVGIIGKPGFDLFTSYANFNFSSFVFNLVFCATTATIVSGAMAERTKFLSYCVYSGVISAVIYPIEAHWIWGGGWLSQIGFHDFAGSCAIHMVGGISALIGAKILGARIGKFKRDKNGKVVKVGAFPGHNIALGALGVFILWLGWYGFNGAAATSVEQLGSIFLTTTIAPAVATVACMIFTWIKYGNRRLRRNRDRSCSRSARSIRRMASRLQAPHRRPCRRCSGSHDERYLGYSFCRSFRNRFSSRLRYRQRFGSEARRSVLRRRI